MKLMKHKKYLIYAVAVIGALFWAVASNGSVHEKAEDTDNKASDISVKDNEVADTPVRSSDFEELSQLMEPEISPLKFVDIDGWKSIRPSNGGYTLKVPEYFTYGFCEYDDTAVLIGMIYMNSSGLYNCATTGRDALNATNPRLTRVAVYATTEKPIIPYEASSMDVELLDGSNANRHSFQTTDSGMVNNHIVYILEKQNLFYVAYNLWESDFVQKYPSLEEFDTIIVKTWSVP